MLVDIWRLLHPDKRYYTYRKTRSYSASRIDFFLVDQSLVPWVEQTNIIPGYKSDHSAINLHIDVYNVMRGRGVWKLNNRLLGDLHYVTSVNSLIDDMNETQVPADEKWELTKLRCIEFSQTYAKA